VISYALSSTMGMITRLGMPHLVVNLMSLDITFYTRWWGTACYHWPSPSRTCVVSSPWGAQLIVGVVADIEVKVRVDHY